MQKKFKKNNKPAHKHNKRGKHTASNAALPSKNMDQGPKLNRAKLYGFHAVSEAWMNENRDIQALYVTEQGHKSFESVLQEAQQKGIKRPDPKIVDKNQLEKTLPPGAVHQGLALVCSDLEEVSIQDLMIHTNGQEKTQFVMLDQVTDPHNVGAILRSACVFGLDGMIMQRKHAPFLDGVLAKTACGAVEHVPVAYETNLNRTLEELKEAGFFVYGLDERGEDLSTLAAQDLPEKMVLIMGAEGPGLRRLVKENCDQLLRLPTSGPISSLNVSNAAAVAFYAISSS